MKTKTQDDLDTHKAMHMLTNLHRREIIGTWNLLDVKDDSYIHARVQLPYDVRYRTVIISRTNWKIHGIPLPDHDELFE